MPVYSISIIQFDDITPAFSTTETVGGSVVGDTYTISASAEPIAIQVDDDDADFDDGFIDPPGNSTGANNQLVAEPVTINGVAYGPAVSGGTPEDQIELEFAFTTSAGDTYYVVRIDGVNVGLSGPVLPQPGQTFTIDSASDGQDTPYDDIPCFVAGTQILTPRGQMPVEVLQAGDLVETLDHGPRPLRRVLSSQLSEAQLAASPWLCPIVFAPGALGNNREMRLSPQHRVLISGWQAELLFGETEVLVPAKALVDDVNATIASPEGGVAYYHLLMERHQLLFSDGAVTESLFPGGRLAQSLPSESLAELAELFGNELPQDDDPANVPARPLVAMWEGRALRETTRTEMPLH